MLSEGSLIYSRVELKFQDTGDSDEHHYQLSDIDLEKKNLKQNNNYVNLSNGSFKKQYKFMLQIPNSYNSHKITLLNKYYYNIIVKIIY